MNFPALDFFLQFNASTIYLAIFLALFFGWCFVPINEEVILVVGGYLAYAGYTNLYFTAMACLAGSICGDLLLYFVGRRWGTTLLHWRPLQPFLPARRQEKARRYFTKFGNKAVFVVRFFSGFRLALFLVAGTLKMRVTKFLFLDILAALINLAIIISLSYYFGEHIEATVGFIARFKHISLILGGLLAATFIVYFLRRRQPAVSR